MAESLKEKTLLQKQIAADKAAEAQSTEKIRDHSETILNLAQLHGNTITKTGKTIGQMRRDLEATIAVEEQNKKVAKQRAKILEDNALQIEGTVDIAGKIGENIKDSVESIPFVGEFISERMELDTLGDRMKKDVLNRFTKAITEDNDISKAFENPGKQIGEVINTNLLGPLEKMGPLGAKSAGIIRAAMRLAFGPVGLAIAAFAAIFTIVKNIRKAQREVGQALGISTREAKGFLIPLKASEKAFNAIGLDGSQIKTTLGEIGKEFGSMENMTVANAMSIERFAQNTGIAGSEVVKLNKVFMDLEGLSFDAATNVSRVAADLAKSAGVNTAKVIGDMSSNAEKFAEFSTMGADGFARAAVEAAKVGSSLSGILGAADKLLDFESSISAQFEAQVLTGKQINLEKARQLSLDGDIAGLTNEIQSIVGQVGDIQSLNVIQRGKIAEAIGISVGDLIKISRGEEVAQGETVLDEQKKTNELLIEGLDIDREALDVAKDKNVSIQPGLF